jgi:hypothetical protein
LPPDLVIHLYAVALGFAVAGCLVSGYQTIAQRPLSFRKLSEPTKTALAYVPLLMFGAPFMIMRNVVRSRLPSQRFEHAVIGTLIACFWSLMSGTVIAELFGALFV